MRILASAFSRSSLGHLVRTCRVAQHLQERGHEVLFACANESRFIAEGHRLHVEDVPELPPLEPWAIHNADDALRAGIKRRSASKEFLAACLERETQIIKEYRPDVILADWRNSLCVLGRLHGVIVLNLTNLHLLGFPVPVLLPAVVEVLLELGVPEHATRGILGDVLLFTGYSAFEPLGDLDPVIWSMIREHVREVRYIGPLLPELRPASDSFGRDRSVYISLGGSKSAAVHLKSLLSKFQGHAMNLVVHRGEYLPESTVAEAVGRPVRDRLECFDYDLDNVQRMAKCQLAVIHGGHGTMYECMGAGVPTMVVPSNGEQRRNGQILERMGIGRVVELDAPEQSFGLAASELLGSETVRVRAKDVQEKVRRSSGFNSVALMIEGELI